MIYNEDLTKDLSELFGEGVREWSKAEIRNQLENEVSRCKNKVLSSVEDEILCQSMKSYRTIKDLDDKFMNFHMMDLDNELNN